MVGDAFEVFEERPGFPGFGGVAIGSLALNRPLELLPGVVVV